MSDRNASCPIWGPDYRARVAQIAFADTSIVDSDRAGGQYEITEEGQRRVSALEDLEKARLTSWLVEQRNQGIKRPQVRTRVVEYARTRRPLQVHERAERLLQYIAKQSDGVGSDVRIGFLNPGSHTAALAWSESTAWREVDYFYVYLKEIGWLSGTGLNGGFIAEVTVEGHTNRRTGNTCRFFPGICRHVVSREHDTGL